MKYGFIKENAGLFKVELMCKCFNVSRSGYYNWLKREPSQRALDNMTLDQRITAVFIKHKRRYGSPRIAKELIDNGVKCSKNRVARRMRLLKLKARGRRKYKVTTLSEHTLPIFPNLLKRDFTATGPNQKWVSDITYVWTEQGWLYLCVFIDLFSRAVVGWSMNKIINRHLVCDALTMALWRRGFPRGVIVHSDRGSQYSSKQYRRLLSQHKLKGSMSKKGDCWDNAVAESFFHTIKGELINDMLFTTREQAKQEIFEYIECYYNNDRAHSTINYLTPNKFEKMYYNLRKKGVH